MPVPPDLVCCCSTQGVKDGSLQKPTWDEGEKMWSLRPSWDEEQRMFLDQNGGRVVQALERPPDEVPEPEIEQAQSWFSLPMMCCTSVDGVVDYRPKSYEVEIHRPHGSELGLVLDAMDSACCAVCHVRPGGLIDAYNQRAPKGFMIRAGDRLLAVNAQAGNTEELSSYLREALREGVDKVHLTMQHPRITRVQIFKAGKQLGITVSRLEVCESGTGILIEDVHPDGCFKQWNVTSRTKLLPGSRIVSVNGNRRHKSMLSMLKSNDFLDMKVIDWPGLSGV
eukprot:TRINITY_DN76887_c0_g1_i1.p1 TRINITY_DN76887_c0_g1~~TRINITY_DN76887_c0_g1_i1.p1  ORF type:complete len:281 (-),score=54.89 TRINITY_DN76887_c0_g1_i1:64-906(-)